MIDENEISQRVKNAMIYGTSHQEMYKSSNDEIKELRDRIRVLENSLRKVNDALMWLIMDGLPEDYIKRYPEKCKGYVQAANEANAILEKNKP